MHNEHQIKIEVQAAFEKYLMVYFKQRNAEGIFAMMGDEMSGIGRKRKCILLCHIYQLNGTIRVTNKVTQ